MARGSQSASRCIITLTAGVPRLATTSLRFSSAGRGDSGRASFMFNIRRVRRNGWQAGMGPNQRGALTGEEEGGVVQSRAGTRIPVSCPATHNPAGPTAPRVPSGTSSCGSIDLETYSSALGISVSVLVHPVPCQWLAPTGKASWLPHKPV